MKRIYIHPVPVRIWHWIHAIGIVLLVITGFQIRFAQHIHLMDLSTATTVHNWIGIIVIIDFALWFLFYTFTGKIRVYFPSMEEMIKGTIRQAIFYGYKIFKGAPRPYPVTAENKFNPLQKLAYLAIMFILVPIQLLTGLLLWKVEELKNIVDFLGGIKTIDTVHVLLFFFFVAFIIAHIYLGTLGHTPLSDYKAMITGWEEEPEEHQ